MVRKGALSTLLILASALLSACGASGSNATSPGAADKTGEMPDGSGRDGAGAAGPEMDQLMVNDEYGVRAYFPRDAAVCVARSWEHPIGFYAFLGETRECGYPYDPPVARFVQILSTYNAAFAVTARDHLPCHDGELPADLDLDLDGLALQGMESFTCASLDEDGRIMVGVAALGGEPTIEEAGAPVTGSIAYDAILSTRAEHLEEDFAFFTHFVRRLRFVQPD